jgi:hypothetical protein
VTTGHATAHDGETDIIAVLQTNLDDINAEHASMHETVVKTADDVRVVLVLYTRRVLQVASGSQHLIYTLASRKTY